MLLGAGNEHEAVSMNRQVKRQMAKQGADRPRAPQSGSAGRRLAYAGAIGGTAVAAGATAALLIARSRRRSMRLAG